MPIVAYFEYRALVERLRHHVVACTTGDEKWKYVSVLPLIKPHVLDYVKFINGYVGSHEESWPARPELNDEDPLCKVQIVLEYCLEISDKNCALLHPSDDCLDTMEDLLKAITIVLDNQTSELSPSSFINFEREFTD